MVFPLHTHGSDESVEVSLNPLLRVQKNTSQERGCNRVGELASSDKKGRRFCIGLERLLKDYNAATYKPLKVISEYLKTVLPRQEPRMR